MKPASMVPGTVLPDTRRWIPLALAVLLALPAAAAAQCPVGSTGSNEGSMAIRLKEGQTHRTVTTLDQTTTQNVMGQQQGIHQVTKTGMRYDVLAPSADGEQRVRVTYESMSVNATTPMSSFSWSSADTTGTVPQGAEVYSALVGQGYTVVMAPDGSGRRVEGWDSVVSRLMDLLPAPPGVNVDDFKETLKESVGDNMISGAMRNAVVVMPTNTAKVGDSWSCTSQTGGSLPLTSKATWTVTGRSGGVTSMKITSEMSSDSTVAQSTGTMTIHYAIGGTTTTTMEVEDATGWIIRSHSEGEISGNANVDGSPMGPMSIPMTVKSTTTTEPVTSG